MTKAPGQSIINNIPFDDLCKYVTGMESGKHVQRKSFDSIIASLGDIAQRHYGPRWSDHDRSEPVRMLKRGMLMRIFYGEPWPLPRIVLEEFLGPIDAIRNEKKMGWGSREGWEPKEYWLVYATWESLDFKRVRSTPDSVFVASRYADGVRAHARHDLYKTQSHLNVCVNNGLSAQTLYDLRPESIAEILEVVQDCKTAIPGPAVAWFEKRGVIFGDKTRVWISKDNLVEAYKALGDKLIDYPLEIDDHCSFEKSDTLANCLDQLSEKCALHLFPLSECSITPCQGPFRTGKEKRENDRPNEIIKASGFLRSRHGSDKDRQKAALYFARFYTYTRKEKILTYDRAGIVPLGATLSCNDIYGEDLILLVCYIGELMRIGGNAGKIVGMPDETDYRVRTCDVLFGKNNNYSHYTRGLDVVKSFPDPPRKGT